jgi:acyl-CoA synthetase (AMP-forming)/AMP-acid ligase II
MILGAVIERNARLFPNHPALEFEGRTITHAVFAMRVKQLINGIASRQVPQQARVAVLSQNCPEYLEIYGAAALGGFIAVGLNYRLSAAEQADILHDCQPAVFVFEAAYAERAAELRSALPPGALFLCIGEAPPWALSYEVLLQGAPGATPALRARDEHTMLLCYTSGTTGRAKGVMLGNAAQLEQARILALAHCARQDDRMLIVMPFYHIGGTTELLSYYIVGATIVLHRAFDAAAILRSIQEHRVSSAHLAPTMIQMMLDVQQKTPFDVSSLHTICYASAPMSIALSRQVRAVFGPIFMQAYGMTEHGPISVLFKHQHLPEGSAIEAGRLASAGQPFLGVEVRVTRDDGGECTVGEIGEICMRSAVVMQGYWNNPEATRQAIGDGWMHSGDLGYFDDEGFLFVVDRKKDMIISGGENIYSREVEETLMLHPAVLEACVIGVPDEKWGESVKAFVALRAGAQATEAALVEHCRAAIASYKKPRSIVFMAALPRISSTNKIDKKKLREPFWANRDRKI